MSKLTNFDYWLTNCPNDDEQEEHFNDLINDSLRGDRNPNNFDNFIDAIYDECLHAKKAEIQESMEDQDFERLGRLIWSQVYDYAHRRSTEDANNSIAHGE